MEDSAAFAARAGLVRAVAQDGSVWYVRPASAARYAAMPTAEVSGVTDEQRAAGASYQALYYRDGKK
jgi:hypothetical protein